MNDGRNANLSIEANDGKVAVTLRVEGLETPQVDPGAQHQRLMGSRNGPARQRRRKKRAEARHVAGTENASAGNAAEESKLDNIAEEATSLDDSNDLAPLQDISVKEKVEELRNEDKIKMSTLQDEFCSDDLYVDNVVKDTLVEEILIEPDSQADWKDVEELIDYNLKVIGINLVKIQMNRSNQGDFTSCLVKIQPTMMTKIGSFPLRNWVLRAVP